MRKGFLHWTRGPIVIPRWMLTVLYGLFTLLGVVVLAHSQPTLQAFTDSRGWVIGWSLLIAVAAVLAAVGSISERFVVLERWSGGALSILLLLLVVAVVWTYFAGRPEVASFAVIALIMALVPCARALGLLRTTGQPHAS